MMQRGKLNIVVDLISLAVFVMVVSTGLVLNLLLPPGSGRLPDEGGSHSQILVLWGLSRHQWGTIHSWISLALLLVLAVHVALHWRFFAGMFRRGSDPARRRRMLLGAVSLAGLVFLAVAPFFARVQVLQVAPSPSPSASATAETGAATEVGAALYQAKCARCHSENGNRIPNLPEGAPAIATLRAAQPVGAHAELRAMTDADLGELVLYLGGR